MKLISINTNKNNGYIFSDPICQIFLNCFPWNLEENLTETENRLKIDDYLFLLFSFLTFYSNIVYIQYCASFRHAA